MENRVLPQPKKTPTFSLAPFQTLTPSLPKSRSRPQLCREIVSPNSPMHILPRCWEILQTSRENTLGKTPSKNARHSWLASFGCIRHHTVLKEEAFFSMEPGWAFLEPTSSLFTAAALPPVQECVYKRTNGEQKRADVVVRK